MSAKLAFLKNAHGLYIYACDHDPIEGAQGIFCAILSGIGFTFDNERIDRRAEKRAYKRNLLIALKGMIDIELQRVEANGGR